MKPIKLLLIQLKTNFLNYRFKPVILFLGLTILSFSIIFNSSFVNAQLIPDDPTQAVLSTNMLKMEQKIKTEYENYLHEKIFSRSDSSVEMASILTKVDKETGTKSAAFWVMAQEKYLHLVFLTGKGKIIVKDLDDVPLTKITQIIKDFYEEIDQVNNPINLAQAQQLYKWIIEPFKEVLETENINNLLFCLGNGVRLLPLVALHDGEKFLVENYSTTRIPAFNLINPEYQSLKTPLVLAMGASNFADNSPLPTVSLELQNIIKRLPSPATGSQVLLNEEFTLSNMQRQLQGNVFNIIHLATHANFNPGDTTNSYIQFWDEKLTLDKMANFPWQTTPDLLVLSACQTALGDRNAELGFTGIALQSGIKSALGSLWSVSDLGTFALITEFYEQLLNPSEKNPTKTEALRQAQNLLLQGKIYFQDNRLITPHGDIELPESLGIKGKLTLSHPFYWAGFTLISSPW
jgi:CHAT domain-containing protein